MLKSIRTLKSLAISAGIGALLVTAPTFKQQTDQVFAAVKAKSQ
ncbi:hypothetical protein [Mesorhizobium sp. AR10]|nr:hypothetical protein [Mesorhizobium sp. AR10]